MKKIFFLIALIVCSLWANAGEWGLLNQTINPRYRKTTLIFKFIKNESISYCTYSEKTFLDEKYLSLFFEASFRYWTLGVAQWLENSPRKEEFEDIIQTLSKPFKLNYLGQCGKDTKGKTDIEIIADNKICRKTEGTAAYCLFNENENRSPISICTFDKNKDVRFKAILEIINLEIPIDKIRKNKFSETLEYLTQLKRGEISPLSDKAKYIPPSFCRILHETGHAFGLSDEYKGPVNHHATYSSPYRGTGVMNMECELTSNDITGMIVLIDNIKNKKRTFTPLEDLPGIIKDGIFITPEIDNIKDREKVNKFRKTNRITEKEYKSIMDKYRIDFNQ